MNKLTLLLNRKKVQEVIKEAEEIASSLGVSPAIVLEDVNRKLNNPLLSVVVKKLKRGKPRSVAYAGIFPKEVIVFLRTAEENNLPVSDVFKEYMKIGEKIDRAFSKIAFTTYSGVFGLIVAYFGGNFVFSKLKTMDIPGVKEQMAFYFENFKYLLIIPAVYVILFAFRKTAEKLNPLMRNVYKYFMLLRILSVFKIGSQIGLQSQKIMEIYQELYPALRRKIKKLPPEKRNIEGLASILREYLSAVDAVMLIKSVQAGQTERFVNRLAERQLERVEERTERIRGALGTANKVFLFIFVFYIAITFVKFITALTKLMNVG